MSTSKFTIWNEQHREEIIDLNKISDAIKEFERIIKNRLDDSYYEKVVNKNSNEKR
jgi:hypothetical protein